MGGGRSALSAAASTFLQARRHNMKTSVSLEVGSPGTSALRFLTGLRRMRSVGHLVDTIHDLKTALDRESAERMYDWHDGAANNLSWRRSRGREIAAVADALGIRCPWFFKPANDATQGSNDEMRQRLLASL